MPDMLVRLYALPALEPAVERVRGQGIDVRRAEREDGRSLHAWMAARFPRWWNETEAALARDPVTCHLATNDSGILGFACHEVTARNYFGPTGVDEAARGQGIGLALLLTALHEQRALGYAYAIIGGVGPAEFYEKAVGAVLIEGSDPGIYPPRT